MLEKMVIDIISCRLCSDNVQSDIQYIITQKYGQCNKYVHFNKFAK